MSHWSVCNLGVEHRCLKLWFQCWSWISLSHFTHCLSGDQPLCLPSILLLCLRHSPPPPPGGNRSNWLISCALSIQDLPGQLVLPSGGQGAVTAGGREEKERRIRHPDIVSFFCPLQQTREEKERGITAETGKSSRSLPPSTSLYLSLPFPPHPNPTHSFFPHLPPTPFFSSHMRGRPLNNPSRLVCCHIHLLTSQTTSIWRFWRDGREASRLAPR